tara:strand:- start:892 stop:1836 length:945 start_codon:yes stop_codon:yes gene_type:complete
MKTKFAIGCLIQWYECDIIEEYLDSLQAAISKYDGEVLVDFTIVKNEDLEKCISHEQKLDCMYKIRYALQARGWLAHEEPDLYTIADYRREFNNNYCSKVDVLMWGESDALIPKQTFVILDNLHKMSLQNNNPKYLAFFGTCKMWDDSWKSVEHVDFTDKPKNNKAWWGTRYITSIEEMNKINDKVEELDVRIVSPHKFNGCGLVISSEVVRAGVNIPESVFFVHEDTAFMMMTNKVLGNIPQYVIKNILLVHNREHPNKRSYVKGEAGDSLGEKRNSNDWYTIANKMCEQNTYRLFDNSYKSFTWEDVWNNIK